MCGPWSHSYGEALFTDHTYPLPSTQSSSSSRSAAGLVRGGQERVETFRARTEPLKKGSRGYNLTPLPLWSILNPEIGLFQRQSLELPSGSGPSVLPRMGCSLLSISPDPEGPQAFG